MTAKSTEKLGATQAHPLAHVDQYLSIGQRAGASDVHLGVNAAPLWRMHGTLKSIWPDAPCLSADDTRALADGFLIESYKTQLAGRGDADFAHANEEEQSLGDAAGAVPDEEKRQPGNFVRKVGSRAPQR